MMAKLKQIRILLFLSVLSLTTFSNVSAQSLESRIDSLILKDFNDKNGPGGAFLVAHHGKTIYQKAFGNNNSGYVLLGYLIELVSGESYADFIKKHIFDKAGMNHSYYASDRKVILNRAYGYHKKATGYAALALNLLGKKRDNN